MAYSEKVIDHYENPRNVGTFDKDDDSVGTGMVGAPACGDVMRLQIKVNDDGVIEDAKFKTYGCGSAIASSSLVTEWVKGKTLEGVAGSAHHGMLEPGAGTATFTVEYPEGDDVNFYLKLADGTYLTSGPTGNELKLEATPNEYSLWYLQVKSEDDGTVFVRSTNAVYGSGESAKPQALEYYNNAFTTYGWSDKAAFIFQLYVELS